MRNTSKHARLEGESIKGWLDRVSIPDSQWFKKSKKRQRFKWYYDIKFYLHLKYIMIKKSKKK